MDNKLPIITITTLSGERVSASLDRWVSALILRLPPTELVALMQMVEQAQSPLVSLPPFERTTIPADPAEFLGKNGRYKHGGT